MTVLILYCVYTWIFMIGMATNHKGKMDFYDVLITFFLIIFAPIVVPFWKGQAFGE
jgi:hypothetical protein